MTRAPRQQPVSRANAATARVAPCRLWGLQISKNSPIIGANRPAKPMWISVLTLKSRGFFNAQGKVLLPFPGGVP